MAGVINAHDSVGNERMLLSDVKAKWCARLRDYMDYIGGWAPVTFQDPRDETGMTTITDFGLRKKARAHYDAWQAGEYDNDPELLAAFPSNKKISEAKFFEWYVGSSLCIDDPKVQLWMEGFCAGAMSLVGVPGVAKTWTIEEECRKLGIPCLSFTLSGLTASDVKGLPYLIEKNGEVTGVNYVTGANLPTSRGSMYLMSMPPERMKIYMKELKAPAYARSCNIPEFAYKGGMAPEFGVLLLDEFANLDDRGQAALQNILSKHKNGRRTLSAGDYVFPPFWLVVCCMNSATEGGMRREDDGPEFSEFIRQRISKHGFYTVLCGDNEREYVMKHSLDTMAAFLQYAHDSELKTKSGNMDGYTYLDNEDRGALLMSDGEGHMATPRNLVEVSDRAREKMMANAKDAYEKGLSKEDLIAQERAQKASWFTDSDKALSDDEINEVLKSVPKTYKPDEGDEDLFCQPSVPVIPPEIERRVAFASDVIESRSRELEKQNRELTEAEWVSILQAIIGVQEIIDSFQTFYRVHKNVSGALTPYKAELIAYLQGKQKDGPNVKKDKNITDKAVNDQLAFAITCRTFIAGCAKEACEGLMAKLRTLAPEDTAITSGDTLNELAEVIYNLHHIPIRAIRWMYDDDLFPPTAKDSIQPALSDINNYIPSQCSESAAKNGSAYSASLAFMQYRVFNTRKTELLKVAGKDKALGNAVKLITAAGPYAMMPQVAYFSKKDGWELAKLSKPVYTAGGTPIVYKTESPKDVEYFELLKFKADTGDDGNAGSDFGKALA